MTVERVVFRQVFEGVFKTIPEISVSLRQELAGTGVDPAKLQAAYPLATWTNTVEILAKELYPGVARADAHRELGRRAVGGYYQQTLIGTALLAVLRLIGPKRALLRTERSLRSANNYAEVRIEELAPVEFKMWMNETASVDFTAGIVEGGISATGASNVSVQVVDRDAQGVTFRVKWD